MMKFKGMIVGGTVAGGWLEADEPVRSIFKRAPAPTSIDATSAPVTEEKETYIYISGVHGNGVHHRWNGFWVPEDKAKFIDGKYDDDGWAINEIAFFYLKYSATKAPDY